jgi:BlaR1 peptidase M56
LPIIAVSPSVLDHLTAEEIDRLIIHEWAHVQRRDDAAQFVQAICRMAAGWHPAVSWLNRRLHDERESACDEMVVALMGSPKAYAASLVKLAALPRVQVPRLPAVGALSSSGLAVRIRRIVSERELFSLRWSRNAVAVSTIMLAAVSSAVAALRIVETAAVSSSSGQLVAAIHVQGRVLTPPDSRRASEAAFIAKRSESAQEPLKTTPPRVVRSGAVPREQTRVSLDQDITPQAPAAPENSAPAALPATPLPSIVAPISVEPVTVAHSSGLNQSADPPPQTEGDTGSAPPWTAAANAGRAVGQGSKNAGVATAGFFTRLSKRIAGSF